MREEKDSLGTLLISNDCNYGIHTFRALSNFPDSDEFLDIQLILAYFEVKKAAAISNFKIGKLDAIKFKSIENSIDFFINVCNDDLNSGSRLIRNYIVVDPLQGGAGTSLNMNINEVIANKGLEFLGFSKGSYEKLHPIDDINKSQSTNDTFPTALKIASIRYLRKIQDALSKLQGAFQEKEKEFSSIIKLGRTQLQDAVPITLGQEFGSYAQAIARDRWRIYNSEERLRNVNLGGTAVGNSIAADKKYVLNVVNILRDITKLPLAKAEDLFDATQNLDSVAEVSGIIKASAVSLIKICNDLRLLSSGPKGGFGEISLPKMQAGSSIMPGKVNPVILENTIQLAEIIISNDAAINRLISSGNLELSQFLPAISHLFLKSLRYLLLSAENLREKCILSIKGNEKKCLENLIKSEAIGAILVSDFSYEKIAEIAKEAEEKNIDFIEMLKVSLNISENDLLTIIKRELGVEIDL